MDFMRKVLSSSSSSSEDYYSVLGCDPSSSREQLAAEFRARARILHPDKRDDEEGEEDCSQFQLLQEVGIKFKEVGTLCDTLSLLPCQCMHLGEEHSPRP